MRIPSSILTPLTGSLLLLACTAANATPGPGSTYLTVNGKIIPAACSMALSGDGTLDFGQISTANMGDDPNRPVMAFEVTRSLSVDCSVPRLFVLRFTSSDDTTFLGGMLLRNAVNPENTRRSADTRARYRIHNSNAVADGNPARACGIGLLCREAVDGGSDGTAAPYDTIVAADESTPVQYFWRYGTGMAPPVKTAAVDLTINGEVYVAPEDRGDAYEAKGGFAVELVYL